MTERSNAHTELFASPTPEFSIGLGLDPNHVAVVEFSNPPVNFFDRNIISSIADACDLAERKGARAILLKSTGSVFCAGAEFGKPDDADADPAALYEQALRLFRQPLPMVVAIQGAAIGGGLGLALAADFRVGSTQAKFAVNFSQIGIHQGFGLSVTLPRLVGTQSSMDLLYTGRRVKADEAHRVGLIDRLCEPENLAGTAMDLAESIAGAAPLAVRSIRRTLRGDLAEEVAAAVVHECAEQRKLLVTDDFKEGVAAVNERRPGNFKGH